jgi:flagellar M-ring protein FliF
MSSEVMQMSAPQGGIAGLKPVLLLLGVAAAVAAGVGIALWSQEPTYKVLAANLTGADMAEVTAALNQSNIVYKPDGNSILVPADRYTEALMKTAGKGVSAAGGLSGLDKDPGFGVSQFLEDKRYQRALQEELGKMIASLDFVQGAQVILAVPPQSAFVRDRRRVSASVILQVRPGYRLDREKIAAVVNLVASGIPELTGDQVTVVDGQGRLLNSPEKNSEFAAQDQQLDLARRLRDEYAQRIEALLEPMLGPGRVHAEVDARIEMSTTEEAREQYKPESQVVRSEQTSEELSATGAGAKGVPGALTNQPPEGGTALPPGAAAAKTDAAQASASPENTSKQATRNFEIDRTVAYTRQPAGRLQRLTVAVLIDNLRTTAADGKVTETPLTEAQIANITTLVREAVGIDEARGDKVSVVNQSFLPEPKLAEQEIAGPPIWEKPMVRDIAKVLSGLIVLVLLLLMVVRPLVRNLTAATKVMMMPPQLPSAAGAGGAEGAAAITRSGTAMAYEQQIAAARSLVAKDPARVAQVVKNWVQKDE